METANNISNFMIDNRYKITTTKQLKQKNQMKHLKAKKKKRK